MGKGGSLSVALSLAFWSAVTVCSSGSYPWICYLSGHASLVVFLLHCQHPTYRPAAGFPPDNSVLGPSPPRKSSTEFLPQLSHTFSPIPAPSLVR
ncbi:uncharacterized protein BP01DRAFT_354898 [Aspergillus saccharolyticus JOP 1030-1]|uniref:Secreted protein n=1 Tax=Aspergillus saccharolyticus JOP 1030-1 TaxID=1450539 RepID=A0A319AKF3_9EURO|nr:hypothetical protein BP01DRAFT_354898 [Aspergillus saccharolyticus JOP 1030-1]PYH47092.1 hypothetical protein BP01DRAFT_354898 [Aspergillus saccharolyticus JOP 1030-1]